MECIHLRAPNDRSGNPRRIYLVVHMNEVWHAIDEGYKGIGALREVYPHLPDLTPACAIDITATEYREWMRSSRAA